ncbi:MAG TPA: hypothetical protein VG742_19210 [Dongiaceae bacterium]|nr:hypothetical protein [Dongiaceae bacterium]
MTQSPQQPIRLGPLSGELVLGIAQDLEDITDRIAEMKVLCDQQMGELADAAAAAAGITETLARRQMPVAADADFAELKAELSDLYETVAAQAGIYKSISRQFLEIARQVGAEIKALHGTGAAPAEGTAPPAGENVVSLSVRREARDHALAQAAANELRLALHAMQESAVALFRAQAESLKMVVSLRQRMRDYRQRTRGL